MKKNYMLVAAASTLLFFSSPTKSTPEELRATMNKALIIMHQYGKKMGTSLCTWAHTTKNIITRATKDAVCCINEYARTIEPEELLSKTLERSAVITNPFYWTFTVHAPEYATPRPWQELCCIIDNTNWLYLKHHKKRVEIIFSTFEIQLNNYHDDFPDRKTILDALKLRAQKRINDLKKESLNYQPNAAKSIGKITGWAFLTGMGGLATVGTIDEKDHRGWQVTAAILGLFTSISASNCAYSLNSFLNDKKYHQEFLQLNQAILEKLNQIKLAESSPEVIS
jgi:hypothetical protein